MILTLRSTEQGTSAMGYIKGCVPTLPACPCFHKNLLQHAINGTGEALRRCFGTSFINLSQGQNDYWAKNLVWNLFKNTSKLEILKIKYFLTKKTNQPKNPQTQQHKTPKQPQKISQAPNLCHWKPARVRIYVPPHNGCQFSQGAWPTVKDERMKSHTPK